MLDGLRAIAVLWVVAVHCCQFVGIEWEWDAGRAASSGGRDGAPAAVGVVADAGVPAGRPRRRRLLRALGLPHLPPARPRARGERRDRPRLVPAPPLAAHLPRVRARARPQLRVAAAVPAVGLGQPPLRQQPRRPAGRRPGHLVPRPLVVDRARDAILRALAAARRRDGARAAPVARARAALSLAAASSPRRPRLPYTDAASSWVPADPALIYDKLYTAARRTSSAWPPPTSTPAPLRRPSFPRRAALPATTPVVAAVVAAAAAAAAWFFRRRSPSRWGSPSRGATPSFIASPHCSTGPRVSRAALGAAVATLLLMMLRGRAPRLARALSCRGWLPFARPPTRRTSSRWAAPPRSAPHLAPASHRAPPVPFAVQRADAARLPLLRPRRHRRGRGDRLVPVYFVLAVGTFALALIS